jgi:hypothetical protein
MPPARRGLKYGAYDRDTLSRAVKTTELRQGCLPPPSGCYPSVELRRG